MDCSNCRDTGNWLKSSGIFGYSFFLLLSLLLPVTLLQVREHSVIIPMKAIVRAHGAVQIAEIRGGWSLRMFAVSYF